MSIERALAHSSIEMPLFTMAIESLFHVTLIECVCAPP